MRWRVHLAVLIVALVGSNAQGYYFWTKYRLNGPPYNPTPAKYDLASLPNKTVTFYVTDTGPSVYGGNDNFASVLSQIRQAAAAWNSVTTSDLRVAFGGVYSAGTPQKTPGGQVIFEQLPPGVLGLGGVASADVATSPTNNFYPIVGSLMHLTRDLTLPPGPSYTDYFFLDVVHEMGHALGLQHTFTASAMSQATTRATSMVRTIDADDSAGISVLYPNASFGTTYGSISGRVLFNNGQPVHLASVVAIRSGASPVSAFTNPDGTYRIDGIPPGSYFVYTHPLPPPDSAAVEFPLDANGRSLAPSGPFTTLLYPATTNFGAAVPVQVVIGGSTPNINFSVAPRASIPLYDLQVYSFINGNPIKPAYLNESAQVGTTTASGVGVGSNGVATPGLSAQILGGAANIYSSAGYGDGSGNTYLAMYMQLALGGSTGPQHIVFSLGSDYTYIAPNAVNLTFNNPPAINGVFGNPDGSVTFSGTNFAFDSRFYLDGTPLTVRSIDPVSGIASVLPPVGANAQHATAMVVNSDGQNSFLVQPGSTSALAYPAAPATGLFVSPPSLPAGVEAMVDITGSNTNFVQGQTTVGFGSSDVFVRRVFVLTPTHLQANVYVLPGAIQTFTEVSVVTGFQLATQPFGFQISAANPRLPVASPLVINTVPGQTAIYPGAIVSVFGSNLAVGTTLPNVTFNGLPAQVLFAGPTQVNLQIPTGLPPGPASMVVANANGVSFPVNVNIDPAPTTLVGLLNTLGTQIDAGHAARVGDFVTILVSNFADPGTPIATSRIQISVNGVNVPALIAAPYGTSQYQVQMQVPAVPSGNQPMAVFLDGRLVAQGTIFIL